MGAYGREGWGRIGVEACYTGRQELEDDPYRAESESHFIMGLLIDRRFGRFRVFLNADNILDTRQTGYDPLLRPDRTADGRWITDVWASLEPCRSRQLLGSWWRLSEFAQWSVPRVTIADGPSRRLRRSEGEP